MAYRRCCHFASKRDELILQEREREAVAKTEAAKAEAEAAKAGQQAALPAA